MPHKLLITRKLKQPRLYKRFLSKVETVHGRETTYVIEIKNLGDKSIPLDSAELTLERPAGMGSIKAISRLEKMLPLKPGETATIDAKQFINVPGIWVLNVKVNYKDKEEIEYYMTEDGKAKKDWNEYHYVVDRHQLDLRIILEELLKKKV